MLYCLICKDFEKGKLTLKEAYKNLSEVWDEKNEHHKEVWKKLIEEELKSGITG